MKQSRSAFAQQLGELGLARLRHEPDVEDDLHLGDREAAVALASRERAALAEPVALVTSIPARRAW